MKREHEVGLMEEAVPGGRRGQGCFWSLPALHPHPHPTPIGTLRSGRGAPQSTSRSPGSSKRKVAEETQCCWWLVGAPGLLAQAPLLSLPFWTSCTLSPVAGSQGTQTEGPAEAMAEERGL
ncbi:hypothetical protein CR201_G0052014 [Pongo abelii]|uniref:Uncharacterized protein n=1 Tax=Pongo abelii TaxID=9601 RepID=A0A2J8RBT3_PONAB|nr:hypothetical protein CR201_G0052014 [Pongo abelii]